VDDLRQAFLAALAPELCAVSGPERDQFTSLAETMGMARLVRAMEVLGRALIDMRDAPDPQVVLEIALVRTASPDLDGGIDALTERVAALERTLSSSTLPERPAPRPSPSAPAAAVEPTASPPDVGRRPSVGAVRRGKNAGASEAASEPAVAPPPAPQSTASSTAPSAPAAPPPPAAPSPEATAPATAPATPRVTIDRDSLTQAWGDGILRSLPSLTKALYSGGRFISVEQADAQFALPNAAHRDRCTEFVPQVEAALTQHFGSPVHLHLVVDGGAERPPAAAGVPDGPAVRPTQAAGDETDEEDLEGLRVATATDTDQASAAEARLLEAFPGASEVAE
jgi:hypothetical protein